MGLTRLKRLLTETIATSLSTDYIEQLGNDVIGNFDIYELSGVSRNYPLSRRDAADCLVMYCFDMKKENKLLLSVFKIAEQGGYKGKKIYLPSVKQMYTELHNCKLDYDSKTGKIYQRTETVNKPPNWGLLQDGETYSFCFMSIDICGSSVLSRLYDKQKIKDAFSNVKNAVIKAVERRNGRIWSWEGDGGLVSFYGGETTTNAVMAAIEIYSLLTIINLTYSTLGEPIKARMALHTGNAIYKTPSNAITSDSINYTRELEKKFTQPMTITLSANSFGNLDSVLRNTFTKKITDGEQYYTTDLPIRNFN